jgi:hypothetical protein
MAENKSLVEEALLQMKNLEQVVAENAKGILASTMKQEISELVKESLKKETDMKEQDGDELEVDSDEIEMDSEDMDFGDEESDDDSEDMDFGDEESDDEFEDEMEIDFDMDDEESPIDLRNASDDKILKVFKSMSDDDGIIVTQDDENIHLEDEDADVEYIIQTEGEMHSEEMDMTEEDFDVKMSGDEMSDEDLKSMMDNIFGEEMSEGDYSEGDDMSEMDEMDYSEEDLDEIVYEIEFDEEDGDDDMNESMMIKPVGMGIGKVDTMFVGASKVNNKGFKEDKKYGGTGIGMGKGPGKAFKGKVSGNKVEAKEGDMGEAWGSKKHEYKREKGHKAGEGKDGHYKDYEGKFGGNKGDKSKTHPGKKDYETKEETKEASRTYSNGSKDNTRGLRKGISNNRNYSYGKGAANVNEEVQKLREKNEEYRKALNVFREKLNEVAVFNSNLAYATRLFTEHTTTKQEKINILRRFDDVETLKESKNLYTSIKNELGSTKSQAVVTESFERIEKSPASGSAQNLIESKTYENPQFLRMKDIMSKIAK